MSTGTSHAMVCVTFAKRILIALIGKSKFEFLLKNRRRKTNRVRSIVLLVGSMPEKMSWLAVLGEEPPENSCEHKDSC